LEEEMKPNALIWTMLLALARAAGATPPPPDLKLSVPFEGRMALAVLDARPDVVNGRRKETFIGFTRTFYGLPLPYHTRSKKPFAQDLSDLVGQALKLGQTPAKAIVVSPPAGRQAAIEALRKSGAERLILLEIREWWSDTMLRTDLHYDLLLTVLDAQGRELGSSSAIGNDELGKGQQRAIMVATHRILENLFAGEAVNASFVPDATPAAKAASCTIEQILKMKEAGLAQEQIEAACGAVSGKSQ
jgi:hypothetical protein